MESKDIIEAFKFLGIESEEERQKVLAQGNVFVLVEDESPCYCVADNKTSA